MRRKRKVSSSNKLLQKGRLIAYILLIIIFAMGIFFFNSKKDKSLLPENRFFFMSQEEQIGFQKDLSDYIASSLPGFKIDFSKGVVYGSDKIEYGLDNLAQKYHSGSPEERREIIKSHFTDLINSKKEEVELSKKIKDFKSVKEYISVRIWPLDYLNQIKDVISREDIPGAVSVLVFDLPSTTRNIKSEEAETWGIEKDDLFELGLNNSISRYKVEISKNKINDKISVWLLSSDSVFVTNHALFLEKYKELIGKHGSLVIIPHRHAVVIYPIENLNVIEAINRITPMGEMMYKEGPGSITSNLYWYYKGKYTNLPYKIEDKKFKFMPPNEFLELLNNLPAPEK